MCLPLVPTAEEWLLPSRKEFSGDILPLLLPPPYHQHQACGRRHWRKSTRGSASAPSCTTCSHDGGWYPALGFLNFFVIRTVFRAPWQFEERWNRRSKDLLRGIGVGCYCHWTESLLALVVLSCCGWKNCISAMWPPVDAAPSSLEGNASPQQQQLWRGRWSQSFTNSHNSRVFKRTAYLPIVLDPVSLEVTQQLSRKLLDYYLSIGTTFIVSAYYMDDFQNFGGKRSQKIAWFFNIELFIRGNKELNQLPYGNKYQSHYLPWLQLKVSWSTISSATTVYSIINVFLFSLCMKLYQTHLDVGCAYMYILFNFFILYNLF